MTDSATDTLKFRRSDDLERIAVLEVRVNDHEEDLKQLTLHQEQLSEGITNINTTLQRILYAIIGAGLVIIANQIGFTETVLLFFK